MNKPISSVDMAFRPEWFRYFDTEPLSLVTYTTVDLAGDPMETKGEPDYNIVMTTGKDLSTGYIYVLEYFRKKCNPGEVIDAMFRHAIKYHPIKFGIESVAYQKCLKYFVHERMAREGVWFQVDNLPHPKSAKPMRIRGLIPVFASGAIWIRPWMKDLVKELVTYPLGTNDDLPDTLAMQLPLWRQTPVRKVAKEDPVEDIFSATKAIEELTARRDRRREPFNIYSVYDSAPMIIT